mmetsp:Transcript_51940/g.120706  ORF Transcript_51940/g.120706 Transcript_51940/m.120706 type:complete len:377 (+) Transcript_51940:57-1187(+)
MRHKPDSEAVDVGPLTLAACRPEEISEASDSEDESGPDDLDEEAKSSLHQLLPNNSSNANERLKLPLDMTTYDSIILAVVLVCDRHYLHTQGMKNAVMQLSCMLLLHTFVVASQFLLIYWTFLDTTMEDPFDDPEKKLELVLNATEKGLSLTNMTDWSFAHTTLEQCRRDTAKPACHLLVNMIWVIRMVQELSEAVWRFICLSRLQRVQQKGRLVDWVEGELHSLPFLLKHVLVMTVCVPQILIALALAWTGVKMLEEATSMTDIVLRALTLQYIIGIDELVFSAFSAVRYKHLMGSVKYVIVSGNPSTSWQVYGVNTIKILGVSACLVCIWAAFKHSHQLRVACHNYLDLFPKEMGEETTHRRWLFGSLPSWMKS